uniref:Uncharacterized protein n=1 Tax=Kwoniella pini CBS 10737 TaxID=1296096 RepID=A0A1B9HST7_9TREE|nr:uncharacterized protein I206_07567 [Kwoniella pini CBS 10737]OCF46334.1 hypothetical protein I206_07567 [Kwoniella pini CBS 10737]
MISRESTIQANGTYFSKRLLPHGRARFYLDSHHREKNLSEDIWVSNLNLPMVIDKIYRTDRLTPVERNAVPSLQRYGVELSPGTITWDIPRTELQSVETFVNYLELPLNVPELYPDAPKHVLSRLIHEADRAARNSFYELFAVDSDIDCSTTSRPYDYAGYPTRAYNCRIATPSNSSLSRGRGRYPRHD